MPADGGNSQQPEADTATIANESSIATRLGLAATALAVAGCAGGGSDPSSTGSGSSSSVSSSSASSATGIDDTHAARFLLQAQFHASDSDITTVKSRGYANWLSDQYNAALGQTGVSWLDAQGYNAIKSDQSYFWPQFGDFMIWNQLLTAPDQLRKRVALALSEYFVVSLNAIDGFWPPYMIGAYWDLLVTNAFGNFRTLLEKITLNAAMGMYLATRGNLKEDTNTGREPDENYAREIMQLFTIGLYELNIDGTNNLTLTSNGTPKETYTQSDISNLAHVFTGYDFNPTRVTQTPVAWVKYPIPTNEFTIDPMAFDPTKHSNLAVTFLGVTIPANSSGAEALKTALDTLFNHHNVGPFFAKQMIQRLVTSNPSPAYVQRVAMAFNDNGSGVRGDLKAVWTAILTDTEARVTPTSSDTLAGKLREPMLRFIQWARLAGITSTNGKYEIYDLSPSDTSLGQSALRSPSVFNFFRPGYVPPNTAIATSNKQAPEFQIVNETTTAGYINFIEVITRNGYGDVKPTYAAWLSMADNLPVLLAKLNLLFTANQLSTTTISRIQTALATFNITASSTDQNKTLLVSTACFLILCCPEYLVQK